MLTARNLVRILLLGGFALSACLLLLAGLSVSLSGAWNMLLFCALGILCGHIYRPGAAFWIDKSVAALECLALLSLTTLLGGVASYAAAALSEGYIDPGLVMMDDIFAPDWISFWNFAETNPRINIAFYSVYMNIFAFPLLILIALVFSGNTTHAYRFIAAFAISLALTDFIFLFTPSKSAAVYFLGIGAPNLPPAGVLHIPVIEALRSGDLQTIPLGHMHGLINYPSFHAAAAILFIWGAWPVSVLRPIAIFLNGAMLIATPIHGGHYFVDLLGGILVSIAGILIVKRCQSDAYSAVQCTPQTKPLHGLEIQPAILR